MTARREFATVAALCGLGAGLVLIATAQPWVRAVVELPAPLPRTGYGLTGQDLAPLAAALGLAGLTGLAGLAATRGWARVAVGVLLVAFGAGIVASSVLATRAPQVRAAAADKAKSVSAVSVTHSGATPWRLASTAGGLALAASGTWSVARGRRWPGLSARYDPPGRAARPASAASAGGSVDSVELWRSLDRGADPTFDSGDPDSPE